MVPVFVALTLVGWSQNRVQHSKDVNGMGSKVQIR
jgi:hypothetical protein